MRRTLFLLGLCLLLPLGTAAQAPLTLEGALQRALQHHPRLRAAADAQGAAEAAARQAGALPNPELAVLVEDTRRATRTTTLQLSQPLELGGKRSARRQAAELAAQQAAQEYAARENEVRSAVVQAYYDLALAQRRLYLADELAGLAAGAARAAALRVAAGKAPPIEEAKARVAEAQARAARTASAAELRAARQQLAAALGRAEADFERVDDRLERLPDPSAWSGVEQRLAATPAWRQAELEVQRRDAQGELERARALPDLTLTLGVKRDEQLGRDQAVLGFSLPLPLFDRNQGALAEALKRADQARAEREALQADWRAQVVQAREQLEAAVAEARSLRDDVLPGAADALQLAVRGYELGRFGFIEVLDAQRTRFDAEWQALRATAAAWRAQALLQRLAGAPDQEGHAR